ncbi:hypothetical protein E4T43_00129 [Aureobasidium subglaciale]|nr:hypothetical protein E4T43_00129 [Aureobasidium subglaciale]
MYGRLSFLALTVATIAQAQSSIEQLTLSFAADDYLANVTFETLVAPVDITCFNLVDVFAVDGNNNSNTADYTVLGVEKFNAQVNYTSVWYQQVNASINGNSKGVGDGKEAARVVEVFPGKNCREINGSPWYGFGCQSRGGERYEIPGGIQSFSLVRRANSVMQSKCWEKAEYGEEGAASTTFKGCFTAVVAAVLVSMLLVVG